MEQIQKLISNSLSIKSNRDSMKNKQNSNNESQFSDNQDQCRLCLNPFNQQNHPIKICINDHNLCKKCVDQKLFKEHTVLYHQKLRTFYNCPFCQSVIDFNMLCTNYKILNALKYKKQNEKSIADKKDISFLQKVPEQSLRIMMEYLTQKEKIYLSSTNLFFRSVLMCSNNWGQFQFSDCLNMNVHAKNHNQNWKLRLKWIQKYFTVIKPQSLKIIILEFNQEPDLITFFLKQYNWVKTLTLFCQNLQLHLAISKACSQVTSLNVSSSIFSDALFQSMTKQMKSIKNFSVIKDDANFTAENLSQYFPPGLESIVLKPHMIQFQQIALLVAKNSDTIRQIELDIEDCQEQILMNILQSIQNVQILKLFHLENIHCPQKLAQNLSNKVRQLYLTKAYDMSVYLIVEKIATPKLLTLDLTEVNLLEDQDIELLSKKCPFLRRINISWCNKVNQPSIRLLITKCLYLQHINVTGIKNLTDGTFIEYKQLIPYFDEHKYDSIKHEIIQSRVHNANKQLSQEKCFKTQDFFIKSNDFNEILLKKQLQKITTLRNVKQLVCISCNTISDKILKLIYIINRKINVVNYYSNLLGLYAHDDLQDQIW